VRVAVLSDIHANLEALQAAVRSAEARGADHLVNLGDVVGYGPDPGACLEVVRAEFAVNVMGNHDLAVAGGTIDYLPPDAQAAVRLHREMLTAPQTEWLAGLPPRAATLDAVYVHAAPDHPELWPRLETSRDTRRQFDAFEGAICFVGHSHRPAVVSDTLGVFRVRRGHRFLVDVGSVGQPRDQDPRLAYALYDSEEFSVEIVREHYDRERTVVSLARVGLPANLGKRLREGR